MKWRKVEIDRQDAKEKFHEWSLRFLYGGLVSLFTALIADTWGPVVGGLFLAFPSILPATMTLIEKYRGRPSAAEDARGAAIGSIGLIVFAVIFYLTAERHGIVPSLAESTAGWLGTSLLLWLIFD